MKLDHGSVVMLEQQGALHFNVKPKNGIEFLVTKGLIEGSAQHVADYLWKHTALLSKRRLGEYLGGGKDFNRDVCECFLSHLEFGNVGLDAALRMLLKTFRLPGEAQMIDRILEKFASAYDAHNPHVFNSSDTVYILSFSLIMLNTDLHNKSIKEKKKMTLVQFLRNNREIDDGANVDAEILGRLYHGIKTKEIRMDDADQWESENVAFMAPMKAGWLDKLPETVLGSISHIASDLKRWFVLTDGCLYYFLKPDDIDPRGIIPLDNIKAGLSSREDSTTLSIMSSSGGKIKSSKLHDGCMSQGTRHSFRLRAKTLEERDAWVSILQREADRYKPLHDIFIRLQQKKAGKSHSDDRLILPRPLAKGWMRKRGTSSSTWTRRYFQLFPDFDGAGPTLFYFVSKESAQMMADLGEQTQSGYLRLRSVTQVDFNEEDSLGSVVLHVKDDAVLWTFVPECADDDGSLYSDMESDMESVAGTDYNEELDEGAFTSRAAFWHYVISNNAGKTSTPKKLLTQS
jgi:cytohesin